MPEQPYKLPEGHRPFLAHTHRMSLDSNNNIYWDGNRIQTEVKIPMFAKVWGGIVGISAVAGGIGGIVSGFYAMQTYNRPPNSIPPSSPCVIFVDNSKLTEKAQPSRSSKGKITKRKSITPSCKASHTQVNLNEIQPETSFTAK